MIYKCKNCGREPKIKSNHTYRTAEYKVICEHCDIKAVSTTSEYSAKVLWNRINKKSS